MVKSQNILHGRSWNSIEHVYNQHIQQNNKSTGTTIMSVHISDLLFDFFYFFCGDLLFELTQQRLVPTKQGPWPYAAQQPVKHEASITPDGYESWPLAARAGCAPGAASIARCCCSSVGASVILSFCRVQDLVPSEIAEHVRIHVYDLPHHRKSWQYVCMSSTAK